jgi:hypothetical protein
MLLKRYALPMRATVDARIAAACVTVKRRSSYLRKRAGISLGPGQLDPAGPLTPRAAI